MYEMYAVRHYRKGTRNEKSNISNKKQNKILYISNNKQNNIRYYMKRKSLPARYTLVPMATAEARRTVSPSLLVGAGAGAGAPTATLRAARVNLMASPQTLFHASSIVWAGGWVLVMGVGLQGSFGRQNVYRLHFSTARVVWKR
jgi:hypothetical protein